MVNELGMIPEDVAIALGHTDGGTLVRKLYGHRDKDEALDRAVAAYAGAVGAAGRPSDRTRTAHDGCRSGDHRGAPSCLPDWKGVGRAQLTSGARR